MAVQNRFTKYSLLALLPSMFLFTACPGDDADGDGYTVDEGDCNDNNADINPGETEICDGVDQNCNDDIDEGVTTTYYHDVDQDGHGNAEHAVEACSAPSDEYVTSSDDCDDSDSTSFPGAEEVCDGADNNCSGEVDEGMFSTFFMDADGDGFGDATMSTEACSAPEGYVEDSSDCDDSSDTTFPDAEEVCDGADNNCNEEVDEGTFSTFFMDADADGFGDATMSTEACSAPEGYVEDSSDCDDSSQTTFPGAEETCDSVDNNCNEEVDEGAFSTFFMDFDEDGFGDATMSTEACSAPEGYVEDSSDCNDEDGSVNPDAVEMSNDVDDNCNGDVDDLVTSFVEVSAGMYHSLALDDLGYLFAWGDNTYGALGDGSFTSSNTPVMVPLFDVASVSAGYTHTLALTRDGQVFAWGANTYGQIGNGTTGGNLAWPEFVDISDVVSIAGGANHSVALKSDGTVWTWGINSAGQLGNGTKTNSNLPVQVSNLVDVVSVSGGGDHTLALTSTGNVWGWGWNFYGQLGNGSYTVALTPVQASVSGVSAISAGGPHSLAVLSDGTAKSWGLNNHAQLGDGTYTTRTTPVTVKNVKNAVSVSAGYWHSSVVDSSGNVWAWGWNAFGQLGDGTLIERSSAVKAVNYSGAASVSAGGYSDTSHTLSLKSDGTVWSWGGNKFGQLGVGVSSDVKSAVSVSNFEY